MSKNWVNIFQTKKLFAVIRSTDINLAIAMAEAVAQGGIDLIEITWNSQNPQKIVEILRQKLPHCVIGAGTILTIKELQEVKNCGGEFIFSPHTNLELIQQAQVEQIPIIPGALTPTEIVTAWQHGATAVKVFPIESVGGVNYLKNLRSPLGHIPLIPTGGVTLHNAKDLINAGAIAVGLSGQLFPPQIIKEKRWELITKLAINLKQSLNLKDNKL
jgi:2-dehydro-3-deoxyphosphogluconate aldolase / (4S)-4-hydroxy-2-oxoglutarate aldolase